MPFCFAEQWELYCDMPGAEAAGDDIEAAFQRLLGIARKGIRRGAGTPIELAAAVRENMHAVLLKHAELGAYDTEPRTVLLRRLIKELNLDHCTLDHIEDVACDAFVRTFVESHMADPDEEKPATAETAPPPLPALPEDAIRSPDAWL